MNGTLPCPTPGGAGGVLPVCGEVAGAVGRQSRPVGAGVVAGPELSGDRILAIERFWQDFFERSGAGWSPERYGAALVRFP